MEFKNRLKELIEEKNEGSQKKLSLATSIPASTINCWFTKDIKPTYVQIIKLAKYFEVSADYLLGLIDDFGAPPSHDTANLTQKEKALLKAFNNLLPETQDFILRTTQSLSETHGTKTLK